MTGPAHTAQIAPALSILTKLVFSLDDEVLIDACWAVSYLSDGSNDKIQAVIESGVVRRLVELLMHSQTAVQTPALRSVGNIVTGDDLQTQVVITSGALPALLSLLSSPKEAIRKEACVAVTGMRLTSQLLDDQQHHRRLACADPVGHRCVAPSMRSLIAQMRTSCPCSSTCCKTPTSARRRRLVRR